MHIIKEGTFNFDHGEINIAHWTFGVDPGEERDAKVAFLTVIEHIVFRALSGSMWEVSPGGKPPLDPQDLKAEGMALDLIARVKSGGFAPGEGGQ